jgi:Na+/H+ antiporter NhaA
MLELGILIGVVIGLPVGAFSHKWLALEAMAAVQAAQNKIAGKKK